MLWETFKKYTPLAMFNGCKALAERDGEYPLVNGWNVPAHLTVKDTVVHPKGWLGAQLELELCGVQPDTLLVLAFGKPYANESEDTAKLYLEIARDGVCVRTKDVTLEQTAVMGERLCVALEPDRIRVNGLSFEADAALSEGYMELYVPQGKCCLCGFGVESSVAPYTEQEHQEKLLQWRHQVLDRQDKYLDDLETYLAEHPLPPPGGELKLSQRFVDQGEAVEVEAVSFGTWNAALTITHDCMNPEAVPEPIPMDWEKQGENYCARFTLRCEIPGNTRLELWVNGQRIVRQVAVLGKGYLAVIPWVGANVPFLDEELHRFDLPGDYWVYEPQVQENPQQTDEIFEPYIRNRARYGDRPACFVNGTTLIPRSETDSLFELDRESQERGFAQLARQMKLLGCGDMELVASYTPDAVTMEILEKLGVKGLTSLCAWQNWRDGGWKINHCGVANQPYYPADDDFRRSAQPRQLMCFTMGNTSCVRNYSIMTLEGCPTNVSPGQRYLENRVVNQSIQRFYDTFDGFVADKANNEELVTITIALESFRGFMDWNAANEMAIRYMVKKAGQEKILFTSAADVSDYHRRKKLPMQEALFFQPDYYCGFGHGTMPGRVGDRIEADTRDYLAVVRRGSLRPLYFYDYTEPWNGQSFEEIERNEFGQIDPDAHKPSECVPAQVYTEDMTLEHTLEGDTLRLFVESETEKKRMVTAVFDLPFTPDLTVALDKADATAKKVTDHWTGNTHLFLDLGSLPAGKTVITAKIAGTYREPVAAECVKGGFAAMWFGDHAYLRSCDRELAVRVAIDAPESAYLLLTDGRKLFPDAGKLRFTVNSAWHDEAPILYGYPRAEFENNLPSAAVEVTGATTCSRWSGQ